MTFPDRLREGASIRGAGRMADVSKNTVLKLMVDLGEACIGHMDATMSNPTCKRL